MTELKMQPGNPAGAAEERDDADGDEGQQDGVDHVDTLRQTGTSFGVAGGLDRLDVLPLEGAAHCDDAGASLRWAFIASPAANGIARVDERRSRSTDGCAEFQKDSWSSEAEAN
jgi:hypothetical protein